MSDFGEEIIERLGSNSNLSVDSDFGKIIDRTIGEWLQRIDEEPFFEQFFLQSATGQYLDLHGRDYGVRRRLEESDEDYRERIIYEVLGHLTVPYLIDVYDVELYYYIPDFNVSDNTLTSDNPYIVDSVFMGVAPSLTVKNILNKRFVLGGAIVWL